jgi:hypothetical protein
MSNCDVIDLDKQVEEEKPKIVEQQVEEEKPENTEKRTDPFLAFKRRVGPVRHRAVHEQPQ